MLLDLVLVQAALEARTSASRGLEQDQGRVSAAHQPAPRAAVAVIFRTGGNGSELLVIERAQHEADPWSGHLAFPGGRSEPGDHDTLFTAKRETLEELGLDLDGQGRLLGALDPVSTRGSGLPDLSISPFAFALNQQPQLNLESSEVASVFWVPIGPLLRGERDTTLLLQRGAERWQMPGYDVEGRVLWGLSYRMVCGPPTSPLTALTRACTTACGA
jgi:8-oxo-dGTP pyrophosphatase MutT (NUDIX family)